MQKRTRQFIRNVAVELAGNILECIQGFAIAVIMFGVCGLVGSVFLLIAGKPFDKEHVSEATIITFISVFAMAIILAVIGWLINMWKQSGEEPSQ